MISILGIIKAHKIIACITCGVIATSGIAGATLVYNSNNLPPTDAQPHQSVSETPNIADDSVLSTENTENSQNDTEIENEIEVQDVADQVIEVQDHVSITPQVAQPSEEEIKAYCDQLQRDVIVSMDRSKSWEEWDAMTDEDRAGYGSNYGNYMNGKVADARKVHADAGCLQVNGYV